jgi:hypothetical protein
MIDSAAAKLHELRAKTDRQLASLISNRLDRGLAFARVLENDESRRNWASMEHFLMHAERAASEASAWIPLLSAAKHPEHRRLEFKLAQLRDVLDRVATPRLRAQAAC